MRDVRPLHVIRSDNFKLASALSGAETTKRGESVAISPTAQKAKRLVVHTPPPSPCVPSLLFSFPLTNTRYVLQFARFNDLSLRCLVLRRSFCLRSATRCAISMRYGACRSHCYRPLKPCRTSVSFAPFEAIGALLLKR